MGRYQIDYLALMVLLYMFDGVDDLVNELQSYSWNNAFSVGERSLQSTQCDPSLLGRYPGEKL